LALASIAGFFLLVDGPRLRGGVIALFPAARTGNGKGGC